MKGDIAVKSKLGFGTTMIIVFPSETCPEVSVLNASESKEEYRKEIKGIVE